MSAEINSMAYFDAVPWHGLGATIEDPTDLNEAIVLAGLNWEVKKQQMQWTAPDGATKLSNKWVTYREDTLQEFGYITDKYHILNNVDALEIARPFIEETKELGVESLGALYDGRLCWGLFKIVSDPLVLDRKKEDLIEKYFLLSWGHDGFRKLQLKFTPVRVVCKNTLDAAMGSAGEKISLLHVGTMASRLKAISEQIDIVNQNFTADPYELMMKKMLNGKEMEAYFEAVLGIPADSKNYIALMETFDWEEKHTSVPGSVWHGYNTVTNYLAHSIGNSNESRLNSNWFSKGSSVRKLAFDHALNVAA